MDLSARLASAPVPAPVREVIDRLHAGGFAAYLVGGCVRDLVRGKTPKDYDVATSAHPKDVQRLFQKVIPTGLQHGTVTVLLRGEPVEVTTFRTEGDYLDGRRPASVEFKTDIRDDLSRRDFTINAMAFDPAEQKLVDPFQGEQDLDAKIIRAVGSAMNRFSEDGLRALRAVRFAVVLGFEIEPETLKAIPATVAVFRKVSQERIRVELEKILLSPRCETGLRLLKETGLLAEFLPEAIDPSYDTRATAAARTSLLLEERLAAWLSNLEPGAVADALKRMTFPNKIADRAAALRRHPLPPVGAPDPELRRWLAALGTELAPNAVGLHLALQPDANPDETRRKFTALLAANAPLTPRDLKLDGAGIMRVLGVGPSRVVGEATRFLMDQVLDDPGLNSEEILGDLLRKWAKSRGL